MDVHKLIRKKPEAIKGVPADLGSGISWEAMAFTKVRKAAREKMVEPGDKGSSSVVNLRLFIRHSGRDVELATEWEGQKVRDELGVGVVHVSKARLTGFALESGQREDGKVKACGVGDGGGYWRQASVCQCLVRSEETAKEESRADECGTQKAR